MKHHTTAFKMIVRYMVGTHDKEIIVPSFIGDLFLRCNVDTNFTDSFKINCQEDPTSSKSYTSFITSLGQCCPNFEIISTNWSVSIHSWSWIFSTKCSTSCLHQALHWSFHKIPHQLSHAQVYHPSSSVINAPSSSSVINVPSSFKSIFHCGCIVFKDNNGALLSQSKNYFTYPVF